MYANQAYFVGAWHLLCGDGHWLCIGRHFNVYFVRKAMVIGPSYVSTASYGIKHSLSTAECLIMHYVHGLAVKNGITLGLK